MLRMRRQQRKQPMRLSPSRVPTPQLPHHAIEIPEQRLINPRGNPRVLGVRIFGGEVSFGEVDPDGERDDVVGGGVDYTEEVYELRVRGCSGA